MQTETPKTPEEKESAAVSRYTIVKICSDGKNGIKVDPPVVPIKPPGIRNPRQVRWDIDPAIVPDNGYIEIDFSEALGTRGPFGETSSHNKGRGHYQDKKKQKMEINSGDSDVYFNPKSRGNWFYRVTVYDEDGSVVRFCDPGVAIDEEVLTDKGN